MHTDDPSVPEHNSFEVEIAIEKLKRYKSPGTDQVPAELIQAGSNILHFEIHKPINSIWIKEALPQQWKGSIIVPIYKNGDRNEYSNCRGMSLLAATYNVLSSIVVSRLTPYVYEISGDSESTQNCRLT